MKIGILTFWQSTDNYGQILQCYALQQYLKELGHEPFLIKYTFIGRRIKYSLLKRIFKVILIIPILKRIKRNRIKRENEIIQSKNSIRKFHFFKDKYILQYNITYTSLRQLRKDPPHADCYIVGSDQVWAQTLDIDENKVFFLDFGQSDIKRISYAASFAMSKYPTKLNYKLEQQLQRFNAISVRETDGVLICKHVGIKAIQVLDPTFLLTKDDYLRFVTPIDHSNYIYIYSLNITVPEEIKWNELKSLAELSKTDIVVTPSSGYILGNEIFGEDINYDYCSIEKWISNIFYSKMMITTSFHGIVFSIILQKDFIYIPLKKRFQQGNNRALDLLKKLDLNDRILDKTTNINVLFNRKIDWEKSYKRILLLKKESMQFLQDNLFLK